MHKGMRKSDVSQRLYEKLDSDPGLKYYLDDENIIKLVGKLIEGIGEVIEENNKKWMICGSILVLKNLKTENNRTKIRKYEYKNI